MAVHKYLLTLSVAFYCTQLIKAKSNNGSTEGPSSVEGSIEDESKTGAESTERIKVDLDWVEKEELPFDKDEFKKNAKIKLAQNSAFKLLPETAATARETLRLLLTDATASEGIIQIMESVRNALTQQDSVESVMHVRNTIRDMLSDPSKVKKFFVDILEWVNNPETSNNINRKSDLVKTCIQLANDSEFIDHLTAVVQSLKVYANVPELIDATFANFDTLVKMRPDYNIRTAFRERIGRTSLPNLFKSDKTSPSPAP